MTDEFEHRVTARVTFRPTELQRGNPSQKVAVEVQPLPEYVESVTVEGEVPQLATERTDVSVIVSKYAPSNWSINGGVNQNEYVILPEPNISDLITEIPLEGEYGPRSGAILNATGKSGTHQFHGEVFEHIDNNAMDARNFFNFVRSTSGVTLPQLPYKRNNFGASLGGPTVKNVFFFVSYEGLRLRQEVPINSPVLSGPQQAQAASSNIPAVVALAKLIPSANSVSANGTPFFLGGANAPVNTDRGTVDLSANMGEHDTVNGRYAIEEDFRREPTLQGNTIPNFGFTQDSRHQTASLREMHNFSSTLTNDLRLGFKRTHILFTPSNLTNPASIGINDTVNAPIGIPQITIQSLGLDFGGPASFPQGRGDTTVVLHDTLSWARGLHALKFGAEASRYYNNNIALDIGTLQFLDVPHFLAGQAKRFTMTEGDASNKVLVAGAGGFIMDTYRLRQRLTLELGLRWDYYGTPTEARNRFTVYRPSNDTLVQVNTDGVGLMYPNQFNNFQPRLGLAWDLLGNGRNVFRSAYAIFSAEPDVIGLTSNPPFTTPVVVNSVANGITFTNISSLSSTSLAPITLNPNFRNSYMQKWDLSIQHQWTTKLTTMISYTGSKGTHLRDAVNFNQGPGGGVQRFSAISALSPIDPGVPITTVIENDSNGFSTYNALSASVTKHFGNQLWFNSSYTWSHSIDSNPTSGTIATQDFTNLAASKGSSDFDTRHRWVFAGIYSFPFRGNRWIEGWEINDVTEWQSGNPLNLVTTDTVFNGFQTIRPDLVGRISYARVLSNWFGSGAFTFPGTAGVVTHFGNLGRNAIDGPTLSNTDFSLRKTTSISERLKLQFSADFFDIFNHPNFGQPGRVLGSSTFGVVTSTRLTPGDFGNGRHIQLALRFLF